MVGELKFLAVCKVLCAAHAEHSTNDEAWKKAPPKRNTEKAMTGEEKENLTQA